jgi:U6 snRNA-associated Sm-like protein LSm7
MENNKQNNRQSKDKRDKKGPMKRKEFQKKDVQKKEFQKKEAILNLKKYEDQRIYIKFQGNREVEGVLKGFDTLQNIVLEDCTMGDRKLGRVVCRGPAILLIAPCEGIQSIDNPFI